MRGISWVCFQPKPHEVPMLDNPQQPADQPSIVMEEFRAEIPSQTVTSFEVTSFTNHRDVSDPLYIYAQSLLSVFEGGFSWTNFTKMLHSSFVFIKQNQRLSIEDQKKKVCTIINYVIDLTDTPYVDDSYADPVLKAITPPIIDLIATVENGSFSIIPALSEVAFNKEGCKKFMEELTAIHSDGFQWSDLQSYLEKTISFMGGFSELTSKDKQGYVLEILYQVIDLTDTPGLPDMITDPIVKAVIPGLVQYLFDQLHI